jgi:hypothetical protein
MEKSGFRIIIPVNPVSQIVPDSTDFINKRAQTRPSGFRIFGSRNRDFEFLTGNREKFLSCCAETYSKVV